MAHPTTCEADYRLRATKCVVQHLKLEPHRSASVPQQKLPWRRGAPEREHRHEQGRQAAARGWPHPVRTVEQARDSTAIVQPAVLTTDLGRVEKRGLPAPRDHAGLPLHSPPRRTSRTSYGERSLNSTWTAKLRRALMSARSNWLITRFAVSIAATTSDL